MGPEDEFAFQLHKLEYQPCKPSTLYGDDKCLFCPESSVKSAPLLLLYGRTGDGSSVCARIRNVYPYFYIELPPSFLPDAENVCKVGAGINFALTGVAESEGSLVHRIDPVQARILYHYHQPPKPFLRISLYSPYHIKKAADACQTGRVIGQQLRCYETHIPYFLQFMMDYGLFGMDSVNLSQANLIETEDKGRISACDLELECSASQVLNVQSLHRFGSLRNDATGPFPAFHVMPSLVAMLETLGLSTEGSQSQSREPNDQVSMDIASKHVKSIRELFLKEQSVAEEGISGLPKAHNYVPQQFGRGSSFWDGLSFGFSSQQIRLASAGFVNAPTEPPQPQPEETRDEHYGFEDFVDAMLQGETFSDDGDALSSDIIPQYDGAADDLHNWSEASHATSDSGLGLGEFSDVPDDHVITMRHASIPPTLNDLIESFRRHKMPRHIHKPPFNGHVEPQPIAGSRPVCMTPAEDPPIRYEDAVKWLEDQRRSERSSRPTRNAGLLSQIVGPTQKGTAASQAEEPSQFPPLSPQDNLSMLLVECFGSSKGNRMSDPTQDPILMVCWHFVSSVAGQVLSLSGVIAKGSRYFHHLDCEFVLDEHELFKALIRRVNDLDPDILAGWEIDSASWGHLQDRGAQLGMNLACAVSRSLRSRAKEDQSPSSDPNADPNVNQTSKFQVTGRICLNIWRVLKGEIALRSNAFEHAAQLLLHRHYPALRQPTLMSIYTGDSREHRLPRPDLVVAHLLARVKACAGLLNRTEILGRTCEFARLFGVDFFSVLSRGSQFKVESLLLRLGHLENFLAYSPSRPDVVRMAAPEALPLVMEPKSAWYHEPVVVLDFQSLYPSIAIAYNLCFTTCLGKVAETPAFPRVFGANFLFESPPSAPNAEHVTVTPNGVAFVQKEIREGLLPKMLSELLDARVTVKKALASETDPKRKKALNARQLGIKYISNVTYGYTAASFSGRMPCVELADAIVQTGRSMLEFAIRYISNHPEWDAQVVYGDTDSLFICLPGRSVPEAHVLGRQIAAAITARCPPPMKLKFEKVYHPCALMSKKRYVGFASESPDQADTPAFDAKGIETVRRDSCALVAKLLERSLKILARTNDLAQVREYVQRQFSKVLAGARHNLADFVFCKEVRLGSYAADRGRGRHTELEEEQDGEMDVEGGQRPHSAIIALQRMQQDPRDTPQYGERVPYVIVYGQGNDRLRELVAAPEELVKNPDLRINAVYYIVKCLIPALNRVFGLLGVDAADWYASLPRPTTRSFATAAFVRAGKSRSSTLDSFLKSSQCINCGGKDAFELIRNGGTIRICRDCNNQRPAVIGNLLYRLHQINTELDSFHRVNCHQHGIITDLMEMDIGKMEMCWSLDCQLFWTAISIRQHSLPLRQSLQSALKALEP